MERVQVPDTIWLSALVIWEGMSDIDGISIDRWTP